MTFAMNQFGMVSSAGTLAVGSGPVLECEFYDASAATALVPGEFVCIGSTVAPKVTKVIKGTGLTSAYVGVVLTNPLKASYVTTDRLQVGLMGAIILCTASAIITAGASLQYAYDTFKVATRAGSNTIVGIALDNAAADGDLIRVLVYIGSAAGAVGATGAAGATGATGAAGATGPTGPTA